MSSHRVGFAAGLALIFFALSTAWAADNPLKMHASTGMGYDNNANLNSTRKSDFFSQETIRLHYQKLQSKSLRVRLSSDLLNVNYFDVTDQNVFLPSAGVGVDMVVAPRTVLETDYNFSYIDFPHDVSVSSYNQSARVGLKRVLTEDVILRAGFDLSSRDFQDRKINQTDGFLSDSTERSDTRTAVDSDLSVYVIKNTLLRFGSNYFWNDSNDPFHDYYDFQGFKLFSGIFVEFNSKVSGFAKIAYERRAYDSRPLLNSDGVFEHDHMANVTGGLVYRFNSNVSLESAYNYRQKNSNEPAERYSGSMSTLGLIYSF